ncbi:MAG: hypothetical protein IIZ54_11780 [Selenomonadaceae bacterium]|nr:hypothetical protein [Selenomonadaceae bacterium]
MKTVCSPWGIVSYEFPNQGLMDIKGGFDNIVLDVGGIVGYHAYHNLHWRKKRGDRSYRQWGMDHPTEVYDILEPFLEVFKRHGLGLPVAYANFLPPMLGQEEDREDFFAPMCSLLQECVKAVGRAGCRFLILRPLAVGIGDRDTWEANRECYLSLVDIAKGAGVTVLLESQYRIHNGSFVRGICSQPQEAARWVDELNDAAGFECFGFHMDIGICSLLGQNMHDVAAVLGSRIKAVTVRDCDGTGDSAMLPFTAVSGGKPRTDWLNLIRGLREISFDGLLIMNFSGTASIMSPLLKPALLKFARGIADHIAWQVGMENLLKRYGKRVLFGAGNMCRAYMKCYGEKYPPLFTCDNDKAKWGSEFCGLEVKNPEALKDLPEDCAILICNVYYREIGQQLKDMGIRNPIGFFNDEYMPSFHFERIEDMEEENEARDWGTDAERP